VSGHSHDDGHAHGSDGHAHDAGHAPGGDRHDGGGHAHDAGRAHAAGHAAGHAHDGGHGHNHAPGPNADRRLLAAALALICLYLVAEIVVGVLSHSLALLSDAGHMLTDAASLGLALGAMQLSARPAHGRWTFGFKRAEILSAQVNGITLLVLAAVFAVGAGDRLVHPVAVHGAPVLGTALAGVAVNVAAAWLLARADRTSLNVQGAFQHVLNDLWAFLATAAAGLVVLLTGFDRADALASLVVAGLMGRAGYGLVRDSWRILLEAAPTGVEPQRVGGALAALPGVVEVHDLHIWTITSGFPALSAHVLVSPDEDCHALRLDLERELRERHGITHTTLQVDHARAELLRVGRGPADGGADASGSGSEPDARPHCADPHGEVHRAPDATGDSAGPADPAEGSAKGCAERPQPV